MIHGLFSREHRQTTSPAAFTADPSTTPGAVWRSSSLLEPFSTEQSPARWLAQIRILTCLILLGFTLREDLAGTAELPERMRVPMGVLRVLYKLPIGLQTLMDSPKLLTAFQVLTATLLLAGVVGWRTRITLPLAAAATLLFGAVWRQYCHLYHTGLLPWYVLAVLCITPCGDALSIDRWRRKVGVQPASNFKSAATYQWSLMLCWAVVAIPYTMCGLSKLASGGLHWWSADNLRAILYVDNLQPMSFKLGWGMHLAEAPDWFLSASAFGVVAIETFFIAVLFSRWARLVLPAMMASIHIGILLFQNVPFPDLIIYQLIFYNVLGRQRQPIASTFARLPSAFWSSSFSPSLQRLRHSAASSVAARVYAAALVLITVTFAAVWIGKVEFYPLTAMRMYSGADRDGVIKYYDVRAYRADGRVTPMPFDRAVPAMGKGEARYRDVLKWSFHVRPDLAGACEQFLRYSGDRFNAGAATSDRIVAIEVREAEWDFRKHPDDGTYGNVLQSKVVSLPPTMPAAPAMASTLD